MLEVVEGDKAMEDANTIHHMMLLWPHWDLVRGGRGCEEWVRLPPLPIRNTWTNRPPKALGDIIWETMCDHLPSVTPQNDAGPHAFKGRIARRKASEACPVRGVQTIYAETEEVVRTQAASWIGQEDSVGGPHVFCRVKTMTTRTKNTQKVHIVQTWEPVKVQGLRALRAGRLLAV